MDNLFLHVNLSGMLSTVVYSVLGFVLFMLALAAMDLITPSFSIKKEIVEDHNTALGIIIGSVFIAMAIIIQAAIR